MRCLTEDPACYETPHRRLVVRWQSFYEIASVALPLMAPACSNHGNMFNQARPAGWRRSIRPAFGRASCTHASRPQRCPDGQRSLCAFDVSIRQGLHEGDEGIFLIVAEAEIAKLSRVHVCGDLRCRPTRK